MPVWEKFIKIAKANIPTVRKEKGCISYDLTEDCSESARTDVLTFVECWESVEHLKAHLGQPHMKAFMEAVRPLRISSELRILTPVK